MTEDDLALKALFHEAANLDAAAPGEGFVASVMQDVQADQARRQIWREAAFILVAVLLFSGIALLAPAGLREIEAMMMASAALYGLSPQAVMLTLLLSLSFGGWWLATKS
jgi:hypothetical protein